MSMPAINIAAPIANASTVVVATIQLTLDASTITALFAGLAVLLSAVGGFFLSWKAATNTEIARKDAAEAKLKGDASDVKSDAALAVANETIRKLGILNASLAGAKKSEPTTIKP